MRHRNVRSNIFNYIKIKPNGRGYQTDLKINSHYNSKPYGIKSLHEMSKYYSFYLSKVKYAAIMQRLMRYLKIQQCEKKLTEDFMKICDHVNTIPCHGPGV